MKLMIQSPAKRQIKYTQDKLLSAIMRRFIQIILAACLIVSFGIVSEISIMLRGCNSFIHAIADNLHA